MGFVDRINEIYTGNGKDLLEGIKGGHTVLPNGEAFPKYDFLENFIAQAIVSLFNRTCTPVEPPSSVDLTGEQYKALEALFTSQTVLLSGGPGTGKTFTIAEVCRKLSESGIISSAIVAAPTGKAASLLAAAIESKVPKDLSITTGTLHSLLSVGSSHQVYNTPLYLGADLIVVDECSMLDITMWYALCKAVAPGAKLLLVGDVKQLPPVDAGSLFHEVEQIVAQLFAEQHVTLTKCLRSESADIIQLADAINREAAKEVLSLIEKENGVQWTSSIQFPHPPDTKDPRKLLEFFKSFRVLCARKEGPLSTTAVNKECAFRFHRGKVWVEPILITKNAPAKGLYNGDNGIILRHKEDVEKDTAYFFQGDTIREYSPSYLPRYELAYALSIHKSQGSEYETVTVVLPEGSEVFGKELFYTAVTRARRNVNIYAEEETVKKCVGKSGKRRSGLYKKALQKAGL